MYSYKELSELAGYTYRVYNMLRVFDDLKHDRYLQPDSTSSPAYQLNSIKGTTKFDNQGFLYIPAS